MTTPEELYETLKKTQQPRGYFFGRDRRRTLDLLAGLITNKKRYGYMSCPCRLAGGTLEEDRDIVCPCDYREADVREHGACYCKLYVSEEFRDRNLKHLKVPERRPVSRMPY